MHGIVEALTALVAFDTTSARSNLPLIDWVSERVAGHATALTRVPDGTGAKANLLVRFGPEAAGGVVLSGHTDCVPVEGQAWHTDPFTLTRDGEVLRGRGSADMKGFIACCVARAADLARAAAHAPVWLALSYDEEIGTLGAPSLVAALTAGGATPQAVLVGEPTLLRPVVGHKGIRSYRLTVTGAEAHSSQPQRAANAVVAAARVATFIDDLAERKAGEIHAPFDPPHTTFNVATVAGGIAINIVPRHCALTFEYRPVPADDSDALRDEILDFALTSVLPRLRRHIPEASLELETLSQTPALTPVSDSPAERLARVLTGSDDPAGVVAYGTDGSHFQLAGMPTVVCGPGSIDVAHRPDEWIALDQLAACDAMLARLPAALADGLD